jgi:L-lactate dehydrogenase (cytochrome)
VPFCLSTVSGITIEQAAAFAPDRLWVQMYRFPNNDHAIGFDMLRRAKAVGARALILTMDVPVRTTRPREVRAGIASPFRFTPRMIAQALSSPPYVRAFLAEGVPRFASLLQYAPPGAGINEMARFAQREFTGTFDWTEVARYRERWQGPLVLKGILHPADAERAVGLGVDAIQVSNHGGRQVEGLPASIDQLPSIVAAVNGRARVIFDSGVRSGLDVVRALALGADFVFAGKAFLWSMGALGESGPEHALDIFADEIRSTMGQLGARSLADLPRYASEARSRLWTSP